MEYNQKHKEIRTKLVWDMSPISRTVLKNLGWMFTLMVKCLYWCASGLFRHHIIF